MYVYLFLKRFLINAEHFSYEWYQILPILVFSPMAIKCFYQHRFRRGMFVEWKSLKSLITSLTLCAQIYRTGWSKKSKSNWIKSLIHIFKFSFFRILYTKTLSGFLMIFNMGSCNISTIMYYILLYYAYIMKTYFVALLLFYDALQKSN